MGRTLIDAVRELCLGLPEAWEIRSHGSPDFRVGKRTFATLAVNHHGDGRVALWLNVPPGAQQHHVAAEPEHFFVPPYVGPRGWLGVELDRGLAWERVGALVHEAYAHSAPPALRERLGPPPAVAPPDTDLDPEDVDPLASPRAREIIAGVRERCLRLPEVTEDTQFGTPCWRAGRKTFCSVHRYSGRLELQFRVGPELQSELTLDPRFRVPAYIGHNGWISLDAEDGVMWDEVESLLLESYRHFALKRMLKALEAADG